MNIATVTSWTLSCSKRLTQIPCERTALLWVAIATNMPRLASATSKLFYGCDTVSMGLQTYALLSSGEWTRNELLWALGCTALAVTNCAAQVLTLPAATVLGPLRLLGLNLYDVREEFKKGNCHAAANALFRCAICVLSIALISTGAPLPFLLGSTLCSLLVSLSAALERYHAATEGEGDKLAYIEAAVQLGLACLFLGTLHTHVQQIH